jgi:hypothetical protein
LPSRSNDGPSRKHSTSAPWRLGSDQAVRLLLRNCVGMDVNTSALISSSVFEWVEHGCCILSWYCPMSASCTWLFVVTVLSPTDASRLYLNGQQCIRQVRLTSTLASLGSWG